MNWKQRYSNESRRVLPLPLTAEGLLRHLKLDHLQGGLEASMNLLDDHESDHEYYDDMIFLDHVHSEPSSEDL